MIKHSFKQGFTLIEMLVVISIIGILSSIILASVASARQRALDAERIIQVKEIQKALELYYSATGNYPGELNGGVSYSMSPYYNQYDGQTYQCGVTGVTTPNGVWCALESLLSPYISELPRGEAVEGTTYKIRYLYKYGARVDKYGLSVILDGANSVSENDGGYYSDWYEVGELPGYCSSKYTGVSGDWSNWAVSACAGGN